MQIYYQNMVWIVVFAAATFLINGKRQEVVCGEKVYRYSWGWGLVAIIPIVYLCSIRSSSIGDTGTYLKTFNEIPGAFSEFATYISGVTKDKGFYAFTALIKMFVTSNPRVYFFILAAIQGILLIKVYRKYSPDFVISLFLFISSTDYIAWMYNGIRQFLAVAITFVCCSLILKKKYVPVIIIILLASTIHATALLLLPFIFIVNDKAWNKRTIFFIFAIMMAVVFVDQFTNVLDTLLQETQYENVVSDWKMWKDDGTNVLRVLVYSIPVLLSVIGFKYIRSANNPVINLCVNMSIVSMGFYIISIFTSGIFIGRLPIYFSLYNYILLPWEIDNMFTQNSSRIIYMLMIGFYLAFYLYSIIMG